LTIICEGRASRTRAELGVAFDVKAYAQHAVAARLHCALPHGQTARQWFQTEASATAADQADIVALLPIGGETSHEVALVWSVPPAKAQALMALTESEFAQSLTQACHHSLGAMTLRSERAVWPLQLAQASPGWVACPATVGAALRWPATPHTPCTPWQGKV